jgi:hypothetical protein
MRQIEGGVSICHNSHICHGVVVIRAFNDVLPPLSVSLRSTAPPEGEPGVSANRNVVLLI